MTIQNLFVAELADIQSVQLQCQCGAQIWFNLDSGAGIPDECHQCKVLWRGGIEGNLDKKSIGALMQILRQARVEPEHRGLKVNLVFKSPVP